MGGPSHRESSLGLSGKSHDTEKPENFEYKLRDTKSDGRVQTGQFNQGSGSLIGNVAHRSRDDVSSQDSDVGCHSYPFSSSSSSDIVGDQGSRTFTSNVRQRNVSDATSSGGDSQRKRYGQYLPWDGNIDAFTSRNETEAIKGTFGSNNMGQQFEESNTNSRGEDSGIAGTRNTGSRNIVTVRGVQFEMLSPRPKRKTGYQDEEPTPQHASSTKHNARSSGK